MAAAIPSLLPPPPPTRPYSLQQVLPRVYAWLGVGQARRSVLCLLHTEAWTLFVNSSIAEHFPAAWNPTQPSGSATVRLAYGTVHPTACSLDTLLSIGSLAEPTSFTVFDYVILGYDWIHSHSLDFSYEAAEPNIMFCAERCCCSGHRVSADVALPSAQPTSGSALLSPKEAQCLLATVGLYTVSPLANLLHWGHQQPGCPCAAVALAHVAGDSFVMACLASLANADITLPYGTCLVLGTFDRTTLQHMTPQLTEEFKEVS